MVSDTFCFLEICVSASGLNVMLGFHYFGWHGSMSKQQINLRCIVKIFFVGIER